MEERISRGGIRGFSVSLFINTVTPVRYDPNRSARCLCLHFGRV